MLQEGQFAPGMPPMGGSYPVGPLPFPLFPMPCDVMCDHAPLFFANIAITNPQQVRPAGMPGGMMTTMRPGGAGALPGGAAGPAAGAAGARPGAGVPGAGGAGATPTRPPGGAGMPTTSKFQRQMHS